ncbi:MAG: hypothetical protein AMXMBFR53_07780 [Gemmatimonadota bacterium]
MGDGVTANRGTEGSTTSMAVPSCWAARGGAIPTAAATTKARDRAWERTVGAIRPDSRVWVVVQWRGSDVREQAVRAPRSPAAPRRETRDPPTPYYNIVV